MDLFSLNVSSYFFPILLLIASLVGSSHCAIMCVPLVAGQKTRNLNLYHLGRLLAYLSVGSVIYFVGILAVRNQYVWIVLGLLFLIYFVKVSRDEFLTKKCCAKKGAKSSLLTFGFLNGLLPCAWLFLILITISKVQNLILFYIFIVIFWTGTVPVFSILHYKRNLLKFMPTFIRNKALLFSVYVLVALYSFSLHFSVPVVAEDGFLARDLMCVGSGSNDNSSKK